MWDWGVGQERFFTQSRDCSEGWSRVARKQVLRDPPTYFPDLGFFHDPQLPASADPVKTPDSPNVQRSFSRVDSSPSLRCQIPSYQTANVLILFLFGAPQPVTGGQCQTEPYGGTCNFLGVASAYPQEYDPSQTRECPYWNTKSSDGALVPGTRCQPP